MQLKTYRNEEIAALDYAAYARGDQQAGRRIQRELDSGTSQKDLARLHERYRPGEHTPMGEARQNSRPATQQEVFDAGVSLDADARAIMSQKKLTYSAAFREAQELAPSAAMTYSRGVKLPDPDSSDLKQAARVFADASTSQIPITVIANLVTGLPRPPSNEIDWDMAAIAVNNFVDEDVRRQAADEYLEGLVSKSTGKTRDEIDAEHPDLAEVLASGEYSEEALQDLLNQFDR